MAFDVEAKSLKHVRVICKHDPAIDQDYLEENPDIWDEYLNDPLRLEGTLKFLDGKTPTVFICNFEISAKESSIIEDAQMGAVDEDRKPKLAMGSWKYQVVRLVLKEIENPGVLKLKKDSKGYVDVFTMTQLEKFKIPDTIWSQYILLTKDAASVKANAKN